MQDAGAEAAAAAMGWVMGWVIWKVKRESDRARGLLAVDRALKTLGDDVLMGEMLPSAAKSSA